jgi:hypothetical protein
MAGCIIYVKFVGYWIVLGYRIGFGLDKDLDIGLDWDLDNGIGSDGYRKDKSNLENFGFSCVISLVRMFLAVVHSGPSAASEASTSDFPISMYDTSCI